MIFSTTIKDAIIAKCVESILIPAVPLSSIMANFIVRETTTSDRPITSNITPIKALGMYYHPGHVKCYHCYEPIDETTGYKEHQGHVYCRKDFKSLFLPTCRACGRPVEREAVSAMDGKLQGKWHLECFGCHICHQEFPDNTFYVFENAPYCLSMCHHRYLLHV
ncbi:hypothetical protein BX666DRAFT_1851370 [Dichotomocladium elegans]|nr:hypothetical protein BX666DRAFT_1851370 [Dichotomocladium elegans]